MASKIIVLSIAVSSQLAFANTFRSSYMSFELPNRWHCNLHERAWTCKSIDQKKSRSAVIVLTAKVASANENVQTFLEKIGQPKLKDGTLSKVSNTRITTINSQAWADGLHEGGEMKGYVTRYLATVKDGLSMLVTFTVEADKVDEYTPQFMRAIQSIKVVGKSR